MTPAEVTLNTILPFIFAIAVVVVIVILGATGILPPGGGGMPPYRRSYRSGYDKGWKDGYDQCKLDKKSKR